MPEYNHLDRCMIEFETCLWNANECLSMVEHAGSFSDKLHAVRKQVEALAREVRDYNDQFETTGDE